MMSFIKKNLQVPSNLLEEDVRFSVIVSFIVETDGTLSDVSVMHSQDPHLNKEALRVVKLMPKWKPGRQNGKAIRCRYNVPIVSSLF